MSISGNKVAEVTARGVRFANRIIYIELSDDREIGLPLDKIKWLKWLAQATPAQQSHWTVEPGGYAVYWPDLDDGIEVAHLLGMQPLT